MADGSAHNVRYYEKEFPDVEEAVMVNVKRIAEMGAYVTVRFWSRGPTPRLAPSPPLHPPPPPLSRSRRPPPPPALHRSSLSTTTRRA